MARGTALLLAHLLHRRRRSVGLAHGARTGVVRTPAAGVEASVVVLAVVVAVAAAVAASVAALAVTSLTVVVKVVAGRVVFLLCLHHAGVY